MRAAAGLLAVALLAACGSGGGGSLSTDDAEALATRAQLTVKDLGPDWRKTADEAPQAAQLDACIGDLATDTLAESHTRTFERTTDAGSQQLVVSSAVLPTDARAGRLLAKVGTDAFADCITSTFEHELEASDQGVQLDRGDPTVTTGELDAADRSAHVAAPFTLTADGQPLDGRVDLLLGSTGPVVSVLLGFSIGTPVPAGELGRLGDLLVERQNP
jgi:hypothetical protein